MRNLVYKAAEHAFTICMMVIAGTIGALFFFASTNSPLGFTAGALLGSAFALACCLLGDDIVRVEQWGRRGQGKE